MKNLLSALCAVAALSAGCLTTGHLAERTVVRAKNKVAPALVHIRPVKEVFAGGKREAVPVVGSGFIITPDGYVVTNEHVAGESEYVTCILYDREELPAEVIGADAYTDIALLKLDTARTDLPTVALGRSSALESGQTVLAFGSPHGLARSVSMGIVSVTDRYLEKRGRMVSPYHTFIQTDAAINPGNSGGPLVNLNGEVVGVNARVLRGAENVGFAIPIDVAKEAVDQIMAHGRVKRSWIGVTLEEMTRKTDDPTQPGVIIADVDPMSPAYEAGVRPGDVLLALDGEATNARFPENLPAIRKRIADKPVGSELELRIARGGEQREVNVTSVERRDLRGEELEFEEWGFTVSELTPAVVRRARLPSAEGVLVSGTRVGGPASNARLDRGDIILKMDRERIKGLADFERKYREAVESGKRLVLLDVKHGALMRYVLIKQDGNREETTVE